LEEIAFRAVLIVELVHPARINRSHSNLIDVMAEERLFVGKPFPRAKGRQNRFRLPDGK
jgi:hypothetical protein